MLLGHYSALIVSLLAFLSSATAQQQCLTRNGESDLLYRLNETAGDKTLLPPVVLDLSKELVGAGQVQLQIVEQPEPAFRLDGFGLRLIAPIDAEAVPQNPFVVRLQCTYRTAEGVTIERQVRAIVLIADVNDQIPLFLGTPYKTQLSLSAAAGSQVFSGVQALDLDVSDGNRHIRYALVPSEFSRYFEIRDAESGTVHLKQQLDRNLPAAFDLTVSANDGMHSVQAPISIQTVSEGRQQRPFEFNLDGAAENSVVHASRHQPVLHASAVEGWVEEMSDVGSAVRVQPQIGAEPLQVTVQDDDLTAGMPPVTYQFILTGPGAAVFAVNQGGYLYLNTPNLDSSPPNPDLYNLTIVAREVDTNPVRSSDPLSLTVHIIDINDNAPQFASQLYQASVAPDSPAGTQVVQIFASDRDRGENGQLSYRLLQDDGLFVYDASRRAILTKAALPAGSRHHLLLEARDGAGQSAQATVIVDVKADQMQTVATAVTQLNLTSKDSLSAGSQIYQFPMMSNSGHPMTYSITTGNELGLFSIDPQSGALRVVTQPNPGEYKLGVQGLDASTGASNLTQIVVQLQPNVAVPLPPKLILPNPSHVKVASNALPGTIVAEINATNDDPKSKSTFSLEPSNPYFSIDPSNGILRILSQLPVQSGPWTLTVIARNQANPQLESRGSLTIETVAATAAPATPVPPQPTQTQRYSVTVPENAGPLNLTRLQVAGTSAPIQWLLMQGDANIFAIDPTSGLIATRASLDAETAKEYLLKIAAGSNGPTADLVVRVLDVNDNAPVILPNHTSITVDATVKPGQPLLQFSATDSDATNPNNVIHFRISPSQNDGKFVMDPDTGVLSLGTRPINSDMTLAVEAFDGGTPENVAKATVDVHAALAPTTVSVAGSSSTSGSPSLPPKFSVSHFSTKIKEGASAGDLIQILGVENKPHPVSMLRCRIESADLLGLFYVDVSSQGDCQLKAASILDREQKHSYSINVSLSVADGATSLSDVATVSVELEDVNDQAPHFAQPIHFLAFDGYKIGMVQISAADSDKPPHNSIAYSLDTSLPDSRHFKIDSTSGQLENVHPLLQQSPSQESYHIRVVAKNEDGLSGTSEVYVNALTDESRIEMLLRNIDEQQLQLRWPQIVAELKKSVLPPRCDLVQYESINPRNHDTLAVVFYAIDSHSKTLCKTHEFEKTLLEAKETLKANVRAYVDLQDIGVADRQTASTQRTAVPPLADNEEQPLAPAKIALLTLAAVVAAGCLVGIVAVCVCWRRYKRARVNTGKPSSISAGGIYSMLPPPHYGALLSSSDKQRHYETQMLELALPGEHNSGGLDVGFTINDGVYSMQPAISHHHLASPLIIPPPDYPTSSESDLPRIVAHSEKTTIL